MIELASSVGKDAHVTCMHDRDGFQCRKGCSHGLYANAMLPMSESLVSVVGMLEPAATDTKGWIWH